MYIKLFMYFLKSLYYSFSLKLVIKNRMKGGVFLFCTLRNESHRIPYFLDYYRNLGIDHFIFVDNGSTDNFQELVENEADVTVYYTEASYKKSNFGMHWLNYLLRKHGRGKWCLTCDPDEFLVYPNMETRNIKDLTGYLDSVHRCSFFTTMIDMYGKGNIKDSIYKIGDNPLNSTPYFDREGYFYNKNYKMASMWLQGGVRMRALFSYDPTNAPAINKVPLVKWKWYYCYISSMHLALPRRINNCYETGLNGVLLHFKFIANFEEKILEEMERGQHFGDSIEYKKYQDLIEKEVNYDPDISIKFENWQQLVELGIMSNKEWV